MEHRHPAWLLALPLFVAPVAGCPGDDADDEVHTDTETDPVDTEVPDDTDVDDTDDPDPACGDGLPNDPEPCFAVGFAHEGEGEVGALTIADWDGDGVGEVLFAVGSGIGVLDHDGTEADPVDAGAVTGTILDLAAGHLGNDAHLDLFLITATEQRAVFGPADATVPQVYNSGEGTPATLHVADVAGSTAPDDVLVSQSLCGTLRISSGNDGEGWPAGEAYVCDSTDAVIATTGAAASSVVGVDGATLALRTVTVDGEGLPTFGDPVDTTLPADGVRLAAGDLDGDGDDDVVVLLASGEAAVLLSDGEHGWVDQGDQPYALVTVGDDLLDLATGDLDGDGDLDVAVVRKGADEVILLVNDGDGALTPVSIPLDEGASPTRVAAGDLDADGDVDLALATSGAAIVTVLLSTP